MLQIYNSFTDKKSTLTPITPGEINLYVCGMTVYDYCHLGHARVAIVFDMISRYLRSLDFKVNYVCNITDIDDKIIKRANERGISVTELTDYFICANREDWDSLNVLPPNQAPRATEYIDDIIALIQRLIEAKAAYQASNGDVYFDVSAFPDYGQLSNQDLDFLRAGTRVDIVDAKADPLDFVLWKMAKPDEPRWPSPWGEGRPGWHIECSAMAMRCLGETIDIHGGGPDLKFPHHENEIAQSQACTGKRFVNTWMHVGALTMNQEKMSKSLGNTLSIREVRKRYSAETIRYFLLASHYRSPINYSDANMDNAAMALRRFYIALRDLPVVELSTLSDSEQAYVDAFNKAMSDDFNTPVALSVLFDMVHVMNKSREREVDVVARLGMLIKQLAQPLGVLQSAPVDFLQADLSQDEIQRIESLIDAREAARTAKAWAKADALRDELLALSIELEDTPEGTLWRKQMG